MARGLETDLEKILATLSSVFADDGDTRAVTILVMSEPSIRDAGVHFYGDEDVYGSEVTLRIPQTLYLQVIDDIHVIERSFTERANKITRMYMDECFDDFNIVTELEEDAAWREKGKAWVTGQGVSNQGRARSDNLAPRVCDGLLFRSQPEIQLYKAFKSLGVSFAPLPVFVRGGESYRRIEPDFVIIKDGIVMIVEVDGDMFHKETPIDAQSRLTMLAHEGAYIERVDANECATADKATACAGKILGIIAKLKATR